MEGTDLHHRMFLKILRLSCAAAILGFAPITARSATVVWDEAVNGDLGGTPLPTWNTFLWSDRQFVASVPDTLIFRGRVFIISFGQQGASVDSDYLYLDTGGLYISSLILNVYNTIDSHVNMNLYANVPDPTGSTGPVYGDFLAAETYPDGSYDILDLYDLGPLPPARYLLYTGSWLNIGEWEWQVGLTPVPEPSTTALGVVGFLALGGWYLRKRKAQ